MNGGVALPINLTDFNVISSNEEVDISWTLVSQMNNDNMKIERSLDGNNWESINEIKGDGTTNILKKYFFSDRQPLNGISYYRLVQFDTDGNLSYSELKSAYIDFDNSYNVIPNPFQFQFVVTGTFENIEDVQIFDILNQNVTSRFKILSYNKNQIVFDASLLPSQIFIIQTKEGVKKIIKG